MHRFYATARLNYFRSVLSCVCPLCTKQMKLMHNGEVGEMSMKFATGIYT